MIVPEMEFVLQLAVNEWEPRPEIRALGAGLMWGDGDAGTVSFTGHNSAAFESFAEYATNGVEETATLWHLGERGGAVSPLRESSLFGAYPDLVGNRLDEVRLTVHSLHIEPWIPPWAPDLEGFWFTGNITWEFYGSALPEPGSLWVVCLGVGLLVQSGQKRNGGCNK